MKSEILSIGDELLIGQVINTNAAVISKQLNAAGIEVSRVTTLGDSEGSILAGMRSAWKEHDIVIATGGLGPTHDDISKHVVARFFKKKLELNKKVLADVEARFRSFGIKNMPKSNISQAMVPDGFEVLTNKKGTAPGLWYHDKGKTFVILPGVPHEMAWLMEQAVIPRLKRTYPKRGSLIIHRTLLTIGIGESALAERIGDIQKFLTGGTTLAFLPKTSGVRLRISVRNASAKKAKSLVDNFEKYIRAKCGDVIFGTEDGTLEEGVYALLKKHSATLSTAESCTGGMLSMKITNIPGATEIFTGGVISYDNAVKVDELQVPKKTIKDFGAVSGEVAKAMAEGAQKKFGTTYSLAVTGIAGPTGGTPEKPIGTVWVALAEEGKETSTKLFHFAGDRNIIRERSADSALEMLRRRLLSSP
jgi:nicotinamide-nucleotide amidase